MKRTKLTIMALAAICISSCESNPKKQRMATLTSSTSLAVLPFPLIPKDTANKMINSYLNSINYSANDTDIQSLVIDAKLLRLYLDSLEATTPVEQIKIMFAHTLEYVNNGNGNVKAGYKRNALTIVLMGVSVQGDYVFFPGNTAFNKSMPCPTSCPSGNASSPIIQ